MSYAVAAEFQQVTEEVDFGWLYLCDEAWHTESVTVEPRFRRLEQI
jgi:hypothetical protein